MAAYLIGHITVKDPDLFVTRLPMSLLLVMNLER
jgi:hypothetical protein